MALRTVMIVLLGAGRGWSSWSLEEAEHPVGAAPEGGGGAVRSARRRSGRRSRPGRAAASGRARPDGHARARAGRRVDRAEERPAPGALPSRSPGSDRLGREVEGVEADRDLGVVALPVPDLERRRRAGPCSSGPSRRASRRGRPRRRRGAGSTAAAAAQAVAVAGSVEQPVDVAPQPAPRSRSSREAAGARPPSAATSRIASTRAARVTPGAGPVRQGLTSRGPRGPTTAVVQHARAPGTTAGCWARDRRQGRRPRGAPGRRSARCDRPWRSRGAAPSRSKTWSTGFWLTRRVPSRTPTRTVGPEAAREVGLDRVRAPASLAGTRSMGQRSEREGPRPDRALEQAAGRPGEAGAAGRRAGGA